MEHRSIYVFVDLLGRPILPVVRRKNRFVHFFLFLFFFFPLLKREVLREGGALPFLSLRSDGELGRFGANHFLRGDERRFGRPLRMG